MRRLFLPFVLMLAGCSTPTTPPSAPPAIAPSSQSLPPAVELTPKTTKLTLPNGQQLDINTGEVDWNEYRQALKAMPPAGLDAPIEAVNLVLPIYPLALQAADIEGSVMLEFIIGKDGSVVNLRLVSYTHPAFALAAAEAMARWKFKPPMLKGQAVNVLVRQEIPFALKDPPKTK